MWDMHTDEMRSTDNRFGFILQLSNAAQQWLQQMPRCRAHLPLRPSLNPRLWWFFSLKASRSLLASLLVSACCVHLVSFAEVLPWWQSTPCFSLLVALSFLWYWPGKENVGRAEIFSKNKENCQSSCVSEAQKLAITRKMLLSLEDSSNLLLSLQGRVFHTEDSKIQVI